MTDEYEHRVLCSGCGALLYQGLQSGVPGEVLGVEKRRCPECGEVNRRVELHLVVRAEVFPGVFLCIAGQTAHSRNHYFTREIVHETRRGRDGRLVHRIMDIARDHDPPFKWHRVIDTESGEVVKNQLIDHHAKEEYDFRDATVEVPEWFPCGDPRASS